MKLLFAFIVVTSPCFLHAQSTIISDTIYQVKDVDKVPDYPGGYEVLSKKMQKELKYPKEAKEKKIEGKVILQFIVNEDGRLSDLKVIQSVGGGCDEEAMRMIDMKKKWSPGIKDGKPVKVYIKFPVSFRLGVD